MCKVLARRAGSRPPTIANPSTTGSSATNPAQAADGTIRKLFARSVGENSVHGSDSAENAQMEIAQFFSDDQIVG